MVECLSGCFAAASSSRGTTRARREPPAYALLPRPRARRDPRQWTRVRARAGAGLQRGTRLQTPDRLGGGATRAGALALHRVLAPKPDYLRGRIGLLREGPIGQRRLCSGCFGSTAMSRSERARHRRGNRRRCRGLRRALRLRCARLDGHRRLGGVRRRRRARPISRRRVIQDGRHGSRALVRPGSKVRGRFRPGFRCGSEGCGPVPMRVPPTLRTTGAIGSGGADATVWIERDAGSGPERAEGSRVYGKKDPVAGIGERCGCAFRCGPRRRPGCGSRRGFGLVRLRNGRHREAERGPGDHFQKPQVRLTRIQRRAGHRFGIGYRLRRRRCCRVCGAGLRFRGGRSPPP